MQPATGASSYDTSLRECVFEGNTTCVESTSGSAGRGGVVDSSAFYNNTTILGTNATTSQWVNINSVTLSRSSLVDSTNGDFRTKETILRGAVSARFTQSSDYYSKSTSFLRDIGIGPSNPYFNGK